ncbi:MAG: hypothetical protein ABL953_02255 [Ilumatobacteraceae bacterium]
MKRRALLIPILSFALLVSCGDDKKSDSTTADTAADTSADTTTADSTADTTADTTADPTTTVVDPAAARIATAEEIAGTYTGEWTNTTFGSTGTINATFTVDAITAIASLSMDLGGNVFGSPDPDALTAEFDLNGEGPYAGTSELFGDYTVEYSAGHLKFTAPAVPGVGNLEMTIEGDFADGAFSGTYTIVGLAEGTFEANRV